MVSTKIISYAASDRVHGLNPSPKEYMFVLKEEDREYVLYMNIYFDRLGEVSYLFKVYRGVEKLDDKEIIILSDKVIEGLYRVEHFGQTSIASKGFMSYEEVMRLTGLAERITHLAGEHLYSGYHKNVYPSNRMIPVDIKGYKVVDADVFPHVVC